MARIHPHLTIERDEVREEQPPARTEDEFSDERGFLG